MTGKAIVPDRGCRLIPGFRARDRVGPLPRTKAKWAWRAAGYRAELLPDEQVIFERA